MIFEWDEAKRVRNLEKHGLDFALARAIDWEDVMIFPDLRKPYGEPRWLVFGNVDDRLLALVCTTRRGTVRVISLRLANRKENRTYEAQRTFVSDT